MGSTTRPRHNMPRPEDITVILDNSKPQQVRSSSEDITVILDKSKPRHVRSRPLPIKPKLNQNQEIQIVDYVNPVPSTSQASQPCYEARPRKRPYNQPKQVKQSTYSRPPISNSSPPDHCDAPELILELLDSERFPEVDLLDSSSESSDNICFLPSPSYVPRNSDSSEEPSTKRYSPTYPSLSDHESPCYAMPSPSYVPSYDPCYDLSWSDSD